MSFSLVFIKLTPVLASLGLPLSLKRGGTSARGQGGELNNK